MDEEAAVYFRIQTNEGEKFLAYGPGEEYAEINGNVIRIGLGFQADDVWHVVHRDLARDLKLGFPDAQLTAVKDFYVFGSLKIDDLMLLHYNE